MGLAAILGLLGLGTGAVGAGLSAFGAGKGSYTTPWGSEVTSKEDYNALFTDMNADWNVQLMDLLGGQADTLGTQMSGWDENIQSYLQQALGARNWTGVNSLSSQLAGGTYAGNEMLSQGTDLAQSDKWMQQFLSSAPQLQQLVQGSTGSLESRWQDVLKQYAGQAVSDVGNELAGMGSLYSGALGSLAGEKVGAKAAEAGVDIANLSANLFGNLATTSMGQYGAQQQNAVQALLQGAQMGQTGATSALQALLQQALGNQSTALGGAGLYGNLYQSGLGAQTSLYGAMAGLQPEWVAPDISYQPSRAEKWGSFLTGLSGAVGGSSSALSSLFGSRSSSAGTRSYFGGSSDPQWTAGLFG